MPRSVSPRSDGPPPGLLLAAPSSGSGKTSVALGLMRALSKAGYRVAPAKVGPDYIDPAFHTVAAGMPSVNLDPWGMRPETLSHLAIALGADSDFALVEGVMGLFDGATDGTGSTADLAASLGWPVVLIVDAKGQAASAAAVICGFASHRSDVSIGGVLFNRVGSSVHAEMLKEGMDRAGLDIPILGYLPRDESLSLPSRHLGLVQAGETQDLEALLDRMAEWISEAVDLEAIVALAQIGGVEATSTPAPPLPPLGQRIAVAQDTAFAFSYPHVLDGWRTAGADILPFSPLADEAPDDTCDALFLPGGYPELHAGKLAGNKAFLSGLRSVAIRQAAVYGECGGYMVLGETLTDAQGVRHPMAGLLPIHTSFEAPKLHLGYRRVTTKADTPLGSAGTEFAGHEFHYASQIGEDAPDPLFDVSDARGKARPAAGARQGSVVGSFLHLIDRRA